MNHQEILNLSESILQKFWLLQFLQGQLLTAHSGKRLRIFSPGWWNYEQGPDFKNCEIEREGELLSGDAEVHTFSSDWYKHKHDGDHHYDNVILHIVWTKDNPHSRIYTSNGKDIEELLLSRYVTLSMIESAIAQESDKERKSLCCTYFNSMDQKKTSQILQEAAFARLKNKATKIMKKANDAHFPQLLYTNMMRACGYKHTKFLLEEFADLLPLGTLKEIGQRYNHSNLLHIQAALYGSSHLLPLKDKAFYYGDTDTKSYLSALWNSFEQVQKDYSLPLLTRLPALPAFSRPTNTPIRRLTAISYLIINSIHIDLWDLLLASLKPLCNQNSSNHFAPQLHKLLRLWEKIFTSLDDQYWNKRFYFGFPSFKKSQRLIGKERARSLILNAFLPVLYAYSEYTHNAGLNKIILHLYTRFPALKKDSVIKLMEKRLNLMFPSLHQFSIYQQGLHGIFELFCNNPFGSCRQCPLTLSFQKM